jgi:hypothetical protein
VATLPHLSLIRSLPVAALPQLSLIRRQQARSGRRQA